MVIALLRNCLQLQHSQTKGGNALCRMQSKGSDCTAFFYFRDIFTPFPPERGHPCCESMDAQGKHSCNSAWASHNDVGVLEGAQH